MNQLRPATRLGLLFVLSIFLPAAVLTYLSVGSLRDERESVQREQRAIAISLQRAFDDLVESRTRALVADPARALAPGAYDGLGEVAHIFAVDSGGRLLRPALVSPASSQREAEFAVLMQEGEWAEFRGDDCAAAGGLYRRAWERANLGGRAAEAAEALNAWSRCALALGDSSGFARAHRQLLEAHPSTFDPDGAHPITLSTLRWAAQAPSQEVEAILLAWAQATLAGRYPLYPGCRQVLSSIDQVAQRRLGEPSGWAGLSRDLERVGAAIDFAEQYGPRIQQNWPSIRERNYLSGSTAEGATFLLYLESAQRDLWMGMAFDIEQLSARLQQGEQFEQLRQRGLAWALLDEGEVQDFIARSDQVGQLVMEGSQRLEQMRLVVYTVDDSQAMGYYQRRKWLILAGIAALVASMGLGAYVIFRDTNREMQVARLRSEFVANVSHELRTPLTAISMYAETLLMGRYRSQEQLNDYLRTLLREGQRLSRLVDNVLDFARIEGGRKAYDLQARQLGPLVLEVVDSFAAVFEEAGFSVSTDIEPQLPAVQIDAEAVAGAVANVLANAVKYSPQTRQLEVSLQRRAGWLEVAVADRGIGVPEAERQRIFDKFHRGANVATAAGTGLGLALVKSTVEGHGGRVEVEGRSGGGSRFRLLFPIDPESKG
ncbi:MAG: hypothetical protein GKR89_27100 [Candidatus Latescibacteria bacterium]|nr:hypothetical protein [Candidatus Latescibacterota bacterium]